MPKATDRTKVCSRCRANLPLDAFDKDASRSDGLNHRCHTCQYLHRRTQAKTHPEREKAWRRTTTVRRRDRAKEYARRYYLDHQQSKAARAERYYLENREKFAARYAIRKAIVAGNLTMPEHCQSCGSAERKLQACHRDYSKPLDVVWLCRVCQAAGPSAHPSCCASTASPSGVTP